MSGTDFEDQAHFIQHGDSSLDSLCVRILTLGLGVSAFFNRASLQNNIFGVQILLPHICCILRKSPQCEL